MQEADNEDDDDMGGPSEKKIKLESIKMETVIKEEPIEPSQFDEQSSAHISDSTEQSSEVESRTVKTEETESTLSI